MNRNYLIMSKNTPVAEWKNNKLTVLNDKLLPLYLKRVHNADMWLETRAIDSHRANSRLLKKALRLQEKDDVSTVIHVNGATITDPYWIKPLDSELMYDDVKFDNDYFSRLALKGTYDSFNRAANSKYTRTPELTNVGSFEKCWKLIDGKWWMIKGTNHNEQFSEMFTYELGEALGMNMAHYEKGDKAVKSLDFTDGGKIIFEAALSFMGDNDDYKSVVEKLKEICPEAIEDYIKMIFLDAVVANPDRHTANFGLMRDADSGELLGFAPCFDHNMALISRGYPNNPKKSDLLISLFNELTDVFPELKKYIPDINEDLIWDILNRINMKVRRQTIVDLVMSRYNLIKR